MPDHSLSKLGCDSHSTSLWSRCRVTGWGRRRPLTRRRLLLYLAGLQAHLKVHTKLRAALFLLAFFVQAHLCPPDSVAADPPTTMPYLPAIMLLWSVFALVATGPRCTAYVVVPLWISLLFRCVFGLLEAVRAHAWGEPAGGADWMALSLVAAWLASVAAWLSSTWVGLYGSGAWEVVEAHKEFCEMMDSYLDTQEAAARAFSTLVLALLLATTDKRGSLVLRRRPGARAGCRQSRRSGKRSKRDDKQSKEDCEWCEEDDEQCEEDNKKSEGDKKSEEDDRQSEGDDKKCEEAKAEGQRRHRRHRSHRSQRRWTAGLLQILRPQPVVGARERMQPDLDRFVRRAKDSACRMQNASALLDRKRGVVGSGGQQLEERLHQVAFLLETTLGLWEGLYAELMHPEGRGEHQRPRVGDLLPQRVSHALTWFLAVEDRGAAVVVVERAGATKPGARA